MNEKLAAFQAWAGVDINGESLADAEVRTLWLAWQAGEAFAMERMSKADKVITKGTPSDLVKKIEP